MANKTHILTTRNGFRFHIRPAGADDARGLATFFTTVTPEDLRFRFLSSVKAVGGAQLAAMTEVDHQHTESFIASENRNGPIIAAAMLACGPDLEVGEVAISVSADHKQRGIGWELLRHVTRFAQVKGVKRLQSLENRSNRAAIGVEQDSGFSVAPYGGDAIVPAPVQQGGMGTMLMSPLLALRDASRTHTFWVLFGTFFVCGASTNGLVQTHFISLCGDFGMAAVTAAGVLAMIGIFDFAGTVGSGWLSDRYDSRWLLFWYYGLRGLSLLYLPFTEFSFYGLSLFAVFYGLDWIATVPPTIRIAADRFGDKANLVFGWIFAGHQLGAAFAAYGAGFSRTVYESYLPAFFIAGALCLFAAAFSITLRGTAMPARVARAAA